MSTVTQPVNETNDRIDIPLQPASEDIWQRKYQLKDNHGDAVDLCVEGTFTRVARALADIEDTPEKQQHWYERFLWALKQGAVPAGRIISNAGAQQYKPATSTINCTVSGKIHDSMDNILEKVHEAGMTLKSGAGIGYEFSTLRPNDAYVSGSGALTSGPLSFMDIYDKVCFTISSAGGRRGAQMATFDVGHPDVLDFIRAKREDGRLRQFNLSLLITSEFMEAVKHDAPWPLAFPLTEEEVNTHSIDLQDTDQVIWRDWPIKENYIENEAGKVACRIYKTIDAGKLWNVIMTSTYEYAEPGFILIDEYNEMNNNWFCENIRTTNPCGEQGLPEYGACLLGSINLTHLVKEPFTDKAYFDWDTYKEVVKVFTRMLDNVVEINGLPLEQQRNEIEAKRRHGMGYLGLGSALTMMGTRYGSEESLEFTEKVTKELAMAGWEAG
ncbi:MAG: ribonucleoside-diphosphate reductase, adenosylcobalamin-dependent, partial [Proteobacteria bacterium]|nr:ribonucleoside-diphosphate reductase, adenosylcobalamin-dependent [Pseudomonadota bacterium]